MSIKLTVKKLNSKWRNSTKGKAYIKKWNNSKFGKQYRKNYPKTKAGKAARIKYINSPKGKAALKRATENYVNKKFPNRNRI